MNEMNRHDRRRLDAMHNKFLAQLPQKRETPHEKEIKGQFFAWLEKLKQEGKRPMIAYGAMSEAKGCDGFIKEIHHTEKGTELEIWGITYKLKLNIQGNQLHNLDLAKSLISEIPREIVGSSKLLLAAFGLVFVFARKKAIYMLDRLFFIILQRCARWNDMDVYSPATRELRRAGVAVAAQHGATYGEMSKLKFDFPMYDGTMAHLFLELVLFISLFLELDTAYRFRVQDAFKGDFWLGLETVFSRETVNGVGHKWKWIKKVLRFAFWLYPEARGLTQEVMAEVDWDKVKLDEDDWYFCLGYISYDFGGLSKDERFAMRQQADKQKEHVLLFA